MALSRLLRQQQLMNTLPLAQEVAKERAAEPWQGSPGLPRQLGLSGWKHHSKCFPFHIFGFHTSQSPPGR